MLIPPGYRLTAKISELLSSIEASKAVIDSVAIPTEIELNIRRQSTLKSSLYSARIEGSTLTLDEVENASAKDKNKLEIYNILKALNWIKDRKRKTVAQKDILILHQITMKGLIDEEKCSDELHNVSLSLKTLKKTSALSVSKASLVK